MDVEKRPLLHKKRLENAYSYASTSSDCICDEDNEITYNENNAVEPSNDRKLDHPTSNLDTMIHLLKGNIGTGILALPEAFKNSGLFVGLFATMVLGFICTHCMHMLVGCSHELSRRLKIPSMTFPEVIYNAFATGPIRFQKYAHLTRKIVQLFLFITQIGICSVYFVFVAKNLQDVFRKDLDIRIYLLFVLIPMILLNFLKNLKYLSPVSLLASILTVIGLVIIFYYILKDLPKEYPEPENTWATLPLYFGTAIYAFEGIGIILPLENNMERPQDFGGATGVLTTGMTIVTCFYAAVGFYGYLKYGDAVAASITLNLDVNDPLAQSVRLMMALAVFLSYALQFYVPLNIIEPWFKNKYDGNGYIQKCRKAGLRIGLVVFTFILAVAVPNLGPIISLIGAVSASTLALIFPAIIEIITFYPNRLGKYSWMLWKDIGIIIIGILGFIFGAYASILELFKSNPNA